MCACCSEIDFANITCLFAFNHWTLALALFFHFSISTQQRQLFIHRRGWTGREKYIVLSTYADADQRENINLGFFLPPLGVHSLTKGASGEGELNVKNLFTSRIYV